MNMFHLGWFNGAGFGASGWNSPARGHGYQLWQPEIWQDFARSLERGSFDFLLMEDSSVVPDIYGGSPEYYLNRAMMAPKLDPVPLVPYMAMATKHLGLVPTLTTGFYHPWLLARLMTTLDHLTQGRIGWNIVTATTKLAWANYGMEQPLHDKRYDLADEFVEVAKQLWDSFPASAAVLDRETDIAFTAENVKPINFEGEHFSSRGPLNAPAGPQGSPVLFQAGGSPRGRQFAAKNAEAIVAASGSIEEAQEYHHDVKTWAKDYGRDPSSVKVMFLTQVVLADTTEEAVAKDKAMTARMASDIDGKLVGLSTITGIDFSKVDLDAPLPDLQTNGSQSALAEFTRAALPGDSFRDILNRKGLHGGLKFVGTAEDIAVQMAETMDAIGGDGILFGSGGLPEPRYVSGIVDQIVPALQRRGVVREGYPHSTFREHLLEF